MLNTFHLRTFLAVVDAGSYSAAAEVLHMSQPAISQQIRVLEEQLGEMRLFRRVGKKMVLTHAGEELLLTARELVQLATRAEENLLALKGQVTGRVVLGCSSSSGERLLPRLLAAFQPQYPAIMLELVIAPSDALLDALNERTLGLVLIEEQQRRRGLELVPLGNETLVLLAPSGHALLKQEQVMPATLREQPLVLPRPGSALRRTLEEGLRRRGLPVSELRPVFESDSVAALIHAARAGLGLAFVPQSCVPTRSAGVGSVDLAGLPLRQEWFLGRLRERSLPRAVQTLYDYLISPAARAILARAGVHRGEA